MIEHLVLFKFKPETETGHADKLITALRGLKTKIPAIETITAGQNFSDRAQGFQVGLAVRLKDRSALNAYRDHPEHQRVLNELIKPFVADVIAVDYEG